MASELNVGGLETSGDVTVGEHIEMSNGYKVRWNAGTTAVEGNGNTLKLRTSSSDQLTIDSAGRCGVGAAPAMNHLFQTDVASGNDNFIGIRQAAHALWTVGVKASDSNLYIRSGNPGVETDCITVGYSGLCSFSSGIAFQSATSSTESGVTGTGYSLDSYEVGTFTPTFYGGTSAGSYTIGTTVGTYTRVGNLVHVNVSLINITESSAGSGQVLIGGFPFSTASGSTQGHTGAARVRSFTDAGSSPIVYIGSGATVCTLSQYVSGGADSILQVSGISSGNTDISFSLTYPA